ARRANRGDRGHRVGAQRWYRCAQSEPVAAAWLQPDCRCARQLDLLRHRVRTVLLVRRALARGAAAKGAVTSRAHHRLKHTQRPRSPEWATAAVDGVTQACWVMLTIQVVPNRSMHMPN